MTPKVVDQYIMLMKAGPYCGYSLEEIFKIKHQEEKTTGKFFWGYSGVFCRPEKVFPFIIDAINNKKKVSVYFIQTKSVYNSDYTGRFSEYSTNKIKWQKLPKEILLVGNKIKSHYALVAKKLMKFESPIYLSNYCQFNGMFPLLSEGLDKYFRYRVDKCLGYLRTQKTEGKTLIPCYKCELTDPYIVSIR